jgi:hypothetical protein
MTNPMPSDPTPTDPIERAAQVLRDCAARGVVSTRAVAQALSAAGLLAATPPDPDAPCQVCGRLFTSVVHECCVEVERLKALASCPAPADDEAAIELDKLIEQLRGNAHAVRAFGFTEFAEGRANGVDVAIEALTKRAAALRQAGGQA